ncbi:uncharacterized protein LOC132195243 [Neocloeon triangulifer]|uniref:uncharacterized protein LOC132195243 n=1 Tax=Neocloeon triangulifer TaxID=2078957 RepID=UPI00286FACFC|nr:uncharacterized protein LOC132195243 [Neocloeon triangulifer]
MPLFARLVAIFSLLCLAFHYSNGGRIVGEGATPLNVIGALSPIHDALLTFDPRMSAVVLPLSSPAYVFSPPRVYIAHPETLRKFSIPTSPGNSFEPRPKAATTEMPTTRKSISVANPNFVVKKVVSSPAASEANFPSSQGRNFKGRAENGGDGQDAVRQIQAYSKPVTIPASGRALFSKMNLDGSYHFGYDTGSGQHQSYREEKRFPGGRIEGKYGYVDPDGVLRVVEYVADQRGYRSRLTTRNVNSGGSFPFIGPIPSPLLARARSAANAAR